MSKLLIDEEPLQVLPMLAKAIGLNEAIVLQQIHYWINQRKNLRDGHYWVYNSADQWQSDNFPFWSIATVKRTFKSLEDRELLVTGNYNKLGIDRTKWYRINHSALQEMERRLDQNDTMVVSDCTDGRINMTQPLPETTPETIKAETTKDSLRSSPKKKAIKVVDPPVKDFIDTLLEDFSEEYKAVYRSPYEYTERGKHRKAVGKLLGMYKKEHPDSDSVKTREAMKKTWKLCIGVKEKWLKENVSPAFICSQFNRFKMEINNNGNGFDSKTIQSIYEENWGGNVPAAL